MSLIPSFFGNPRSNVFDPFSLDVWDPFEGFPFSTGVSNLPSSARETTAIANARIDWKETPEAHVFKMMFLTEESLDKLWSLQISGQRECTVEESSGKFLRRFRLPECQIGSSKAAMENGVLTVTVPKEEVKKPEAKAIDISG
ncbi:class I heat shock protein [Sesamum angolense]|uniref:Class I heat shock protein n=1 Tax=Sesamum angolense TaxID=2727404 RepID=A0AAE1X1D4_9LAMI|nr:class I heat shock protein [Sesamum angolense]